MDPSARDSHGAFGTEGHPRRWAILAVLVVSLLVVVLDNTILNIALPTIQRELDASQSELIWAIDAYVLVFAALLFSWGVMGDRIGRKKVLIIGLTIFGVASAIAAFSASSGMLIGMRAVMGVGGAAVLPTTLAIITVVFPPHERGKAIGAWAAAVGAAGTVGNAGSATAGRGVLYYFCDGRAAWGGIADCREWFPPGEVSAGRVCRSRRSWPRGEEGKDEVGGRKRYGGDEAAQRVGEHYMEGVPCAWGE